MVGKPLELMQEPGRVLDSRTGYFFFVSIFVLCQSHSASWIMYHVSSVSGPDFDMALYINIYFKLKSLNTQSSPEVQTVTHNPQRYCFKYILPEDKLFTAQELFLGMIFPIKSIVKQMSHLSIQFIKYSQILMCCTNFTISVLKTKRYHRRKP